jgi:hypothetical protein
MELGFNTMSAVIIDIWNKYSKELLDLGVCCDLNDTKDGGREICIFYKNEKTKINFNYMEIKDTELKERLERLKSDGKRKKGCSDCKKKKVEVKLQPIEDNLFIPSQEEIRLAYAELTSILGVKEDKKELISNVYKYLFNEEFDWNCRSCVNNQARRFRIHMTGK